ncbi:MAG: ester cyclase [Bacteroidetes bacterium]|nr:ester cyclase [Bacteroidota bacterium]
MKSFYTLALAITTLTQAHAQDIPVPHSLTIDKTLSPSQAKIMQETTLSFYAFWNTGKKQYLDKVISPTFKDNTLPEGRPQGPTGPSFASETFRKAVPDLKCTVNDLLITGEKSTIRMQFTGTFTGVFKDQKGKGQHISFLAIDILHIKDGKIIEDWHLEDNLTLLQQLEVIKK